MRTVRPRPAKAMAASRAARLSPPPLRLPNGIRAQLVAGEALGLEDLRKAGGAQLPHRLIGHPPAFLDVCRALAQRWQQCLGAGDQFRLGGNRQLYFRRFDLDVHGHILSRIRLPGRGA